ncbi:Pepco domain-containing protein [Microseira wollei]|uniref:Pepco domain-containing protein n=1 Tax=Microseira wollei NIES-4236 TaxID=2530354 RepID=A0AAV3XDG0_9CYAN|nr:hypothetical protein [Microseira wollei]GET39920.1 hypothetical protein MiSe_46920 [Microseira wollei NIES-4236]
MMGEEDIIWIVTNETSPIGVTDGRKDGTPLGGSWSDEVKPGTDTKKVGDAVPVRVQKLEQEMTRFLQVVGRLFQRAEQQAKVDSPGMQLDEIELVVEINGEGAVKLLGTGGKVGGKGGITLRFKRKETQ